MGSSTYLNISELEETMEEFMDSSLAPSLSVDDTELTTDSTIGV